MSADEIDELVENEIRLANIEALAAAVLALGRHNIATDVQELLVCGDGRGTVGPGALQAACEAYIASLRTHRHKLVKDERK